MGCDRIHSGGRGSAAEAVRHLIRQSINDRFSASLQALYDAPWRNNDCPGCGGWGVEDEQSYERRPCPQCSTYVRTCHALHDRYGAVLTEPIPDDMRELLAKLK